MNKTSDLVSRWHVGRIHPTPDVEPGGWKLERLCDIARLESGHTPSRNRPDYWDGDIPWLSLHDSKNIEGKTLYNTKMTVSALGLANSSARLLPEGTVALSRTATIGKVAILGREMATSQDFACYVCGPRLLNAYLAHLFRGMEAEWERLMAGSTHNTIYMPSFENMQVLVPPLAEQEAIAEALSDADALIEGLERLIAKKRLIKQGAMQDLLTAKRRLPGFSGKWERYKLSDLGEISGSGVDKKVVKNERPVRLLNYMDVYREPYISGNILNHWVTAPETKARRCQIRAGDVFFTPTSETPEDIARSTVAVDDIPDAAYSYHVVRLRLNEADSYDFWAHAFETEEFRRQSRLNADGSGTRYVITLPKFRNMRVNVPTKSEREAIGIVLRDMHDEIKALETRLDKARQVKEGMMQNLLTGRIRLV